MHFMLLPFLPLFALAQNQVAPAPPPDEAAIWVHEHFTKREESIAMRDGVHLFTSIYAPKDAGTPGTPTYPILLCRTPYSVAPYGADKFKTSVGPSELFARSGWIVAYQDVRGCYMSEGKFVDVRPEHAGAHSPKNAKDIDESSDAWDSIDWLVKNVAGNNGHVGMWGISYPGYYAAAGMIDAHPALKAVSPQAPIADWFWDDFHHHGALFLPHAFNFLSGFGRPRPEPTTSRAFPFDHGMKDGYQFFLELGPLKNANERWFHHDVAFWDELVQHPDYDAFWKERDLQPQLQHVAPAVMTVGGWFDAEDLFGALHVYSAVERQNPGIFNVLVMGPWQHGGWSRTEGEHLGNVHFGSKTAHEYQQRLELAFFERFLKDKKGSDIAEANVFETGANRWRTFDAWPPKARVEKSIYLGAGGKLSFDAPAENGDAARDEFISDPAHPVPFTEAIAIGMTREYMTDDQRFASKRNDVLTYESDPLANDLTLAGPLTAELWASTSGTDSDWIVKLIDVFPPDTKDPPDQPRNTSMSGYAMMVRSEVLRGRYRESYSKPKAFVPNEPTRVNVPLQDVLHTFQKGHRVEVQIESTWFPLVDRNPQTFVPNIYLAEEKDFVSATQRVYRSKDHPSRLNVGMLEQAR